MTATFLEATPCGVTNLSIAGHWKIAVQTAIDMMLKDRPTKMSTCV
jgi:hypothetical protein